MSTCTRPIAPVPRRWYGRVLGLTRVSEFEHWATKDGPLFLSNPERSVSIALFERPPQPTRSVVAFRINGKDFIAWRNHLRELLGSVERWTMTVPGRFTLQILMEIPLRSLLTITSI
jgi:hypothetical protein